MTSYEVGEDHASSMLTLQQEGFKVERIAFGNADTWHGSSDLRIDQVYVVSKYMKVTTYKYMWLSIWEWVSKSVFNAKGKLTSSLQLPLLSAE